MSDCNGKILFLGDQGTDQPQVQGVRQGTVCLEALLLVPHRGR